MSSFLEQYFSLSGKTAVVIGGTGELCGTMAEGLASAGAHVILVGRNEEKAKARLESIHSKGGKAEFYAAEATSQTDLKNLLDHAVSTHRKVDILINGAGVNSPTPYLEIQEEEFQRILDVNLKGVFLACQVFGKYFLENQIKASIINLGSMSGLIPLSRVFTYSLSKAAVHNLSKNLAREWAEHGIRVNTIVPGFFPAEQNRKVLNESRVNAILGHTPIKRFGESQELIGATLLLASNTASSYMSGSELVVDGGYSSMTI